MKKLNGCQIPSLAEVSEGKADVGPQTLIISIKRKLAKPWNNVIKKRLKKYCAFIKKGNSQSAHGKATTGLKTGDIVRVRSRECIKATLDHFNEVKGCAFMESMWHYCGTTQVVLKPLERFLDERDYKVKKCSGIVLLDGVLCNGTPVFGRCDRCCHLFWREEWLEKIDEHP